MTLTHPHPGIARLTLNAAPVNALTPAKLMGLKAVADRLSGRERVRAIVIDSALRVFSAGLNLKDAQHYDDADQAAIVHGLNIGFHALFACPKPVIVACDGAAIAGGLFFVLSADWRIATPRASFGLAEVRVGVDFPVGPMEIARDTLDPTALRRLIQRGQPIDASTAQEWGVIDEIVEASPVDRALEVAVEYAAIPPLAYAQVKRQVRGATIERIAKAMDRTPDPWFNVETRAAMAQMLR
ncbi:enoyl-CoA hydratase/isomerase family protein [Sulfitobacter albidus]|uniref:Enoyl-CoA hydratase/isomerase family protein n=1 Tax=Sulfitobacter albidus TaxID=2829501 RepID=A0A975JHD9_9RHOB|nr:enoyl-CoA hydratase/isomerase family protein [Sulfitobacter albidus]